MTAAAIVQLLEWHLISCRAQMAMAVVTVVTHTTIHMAETATTTRMAETATTTRMAETTTTRMTPMAATDMNHIIH